MDSKLAVQRLFRGILLRSASSSEEKLFAQLFDNRSLSEEQLVVLGWQSEEFLTKVAPIALLDYAISGITNGARVIGWYNSPSGTPLAPTGSDRTQNAMQVMLSGYGLLQPGSQSELSRAILDIGIRLGFSLSSATADSLASQITAGSMSMLSLMNDAVTLAISQRPQLLTQIGSSLLESVLSENTTLPGAAGMAPVDQADAITESYLAPSLIVPVDGLIYESTANDGSITATELQLIGTAWRGKVGDTILTLTGLPLGLSGKIVVTGSQTAEIRFTGKARSHDEAASKSITLTFTDAHFLGSKAADVAPLVKGATTLGLQFFNNDPWSLGGSSMSLFGSAAISIDLLAASGTIGSTEVSAADLTGIASLDARAVTAAVTLSGNTAANTLHAGSGGSTLRGRDGNDTLYAGKGIDTFVFEATAEAGASGIAGNGLDKIHGFKIGEGGDKLDFREFLGTPAIGATISGAGAGSAWSNGEIIVVYENGSPLTTASEIAALFGTALAAPTAPARVVIFTAGVPGPTDPGTASAWFVSNRSSSGSVSAIEAAEVVKVAELVGINNLGLTSLHADNLLI